MCQQNHTYAHEEGGKPTAAIDVFAEKDLCSGSVADEGERRGLRPTPDETDFERDEVGVS